MLEVQLHFLATYFTWIWLQTRLTDKSKYSGTCSKWLKPERGYSPMCTGASLCGNSVWAKCNGYQSVTAVLNAKTHENNRVHKSTDHDHQDTF